MNNNNTNQNGNQAGVVNSTQQNPNMSVQQSSIPDAQQLEVTNNYRPMMLTEEEKPEQANMAMPKVVSMPPQTAPDVSTAHVDNMPSMTPPQTIPTQVNTPISTPPLNNIPVPPLSPVKPPVEEKIGKARTALNSVPSYIPFIKTPDIPLTSTTQDHLPIADIVDDIVIYKDGGAAVVLETSSLNFGLLSEKEQVAVVSAYAALINSLSFSIQISVRTQRKDISGYINFFDTESKKITNPKLTAITANYKAFITESIKKKTVLGKRFFIAIPFSPLELGVTKSAQSVLKRGKLPFPKDYVIKKAKITLYPKRDHIIRQAGRLGLKLKQLTTKDLIDLYWSINNPEPPAVKKEIKI